MPATVTLKAVGLNFSPNNLETPDGSLVQASNVIIKRDDVFESRRGFKLYGNSFGTSTDVAKQLMIYQNRILRHFNDTIQFDDGTGTFSSFFGSYLETQTGLRLKSIESNGNLYFTTSEGIKKISTSTADDFTTSSGGITQAGGVKALDLTAKLKVSLGQQSGFFSQDGAVAYRAVWGITDANNNIILGSPSARVEIFNSLLTLLLQDFLRVLGALDDINQTGSLINDGDYVSSLKLNSSSTATDLRNNLISLATKIDNDILYADNDGLPTGAPLEIDTATITTGSCQVTFASGDPTTYLSIGSKIYLNGFSPATGTLDGAQTIVSLDSTSITFDTTASGAVTIDPSATIVSNAYRSITQPSVPDLPATDQQLVNLQTYLENIILQLQSEPNGVIPSALQTEFITPLDITTSATVELTVTIPQDVTINHFLQVYRSSVITATDQTTIGDIAPNDELQLVYEAFPTQTELDARSITFEDITPDEFRGANLYTNPSTGEGILQSNDIPPYAKDLNKFKNVTFYANTKTRHRSNMSLIGIANMISDYNNSITPKITISNSTLFNTYDFIVGANEVTQIVTVADVADSLNGTYFLINSANNNDKYYVWYKTSGGTETDPAISGRTGILVIINTGDTANDVATKTANTLTTLLTKFSVSVLTDTITITNVDVGYTDDAVDGTTGFAISVTTQGIGERVTRETSKFTCVADVAGSLAGTYFTLNTAFNLDQYYVWYKVSGSGADPAVANKTGILVNIDTNDTASTVAQKTSDTLNTYSTKFIASHNSSILTVQNYRYGKANDATAGTTGFTLSITQQGALEVLLSSAVSPAQAIDETARSLVRVINTNISESVYGYYLSGETEVPGKFLLESRILSDNPFYVLANNSNTGNSFNPTISPTINISSISTGSPTTMLITTATNHGMINKDYVVITNTNSTPIIDGLYQITYVSANSFRIPVTVTNSGTTGSIIPQKQAEVSTNEVKQNRIYYSKLQQPEAVPIVNYFDVGAANKAILRILPLRDSLFVYKEDGLFRVSGEIAPFNLALFDSSVILLAPDTLTIANNSQYGWTSQGIMSITEAGASIISRPIDTEILKLASSSYPNFKTIAWGVGYDSDNSYLVYTGKNPSDTVATIAYRFGNLTNSWTNFDKTNTCGIVNPADDKLYLGAGDINYIEQERKSFTRLDYSDRELDFTIDEHKFFGNKIILNDVSGLSIGDVVTQEQYLTITHFNSALKKLDLDPGINENDFYSTLAALPGDNLRTKIEDLATKLDSNTNIVQNDFLSTISPKSGTITAITADNPTQITSATHDLFSDRVVLITNADSSPNIDGTYLVTVLDNNTFTVDKSVIVPGTTGNFDTLVDDFRDIKACFNKIMSKLNLDSGTSYSNYVSIDTTTTEETVIIDVNKNTKTITLDLELPFIIGNIIIFKAIDCSFTYSPVTFNDPLSLKHVREATVMFQNKAFTNATVSFATDLLPMFNEVEFNGDGSGIFGFSPFGSGFFGGNSHGAPFRTYIPKDCQRCRYMNVKFNHKVARENFSLFGITLTGEVSQSSRAYR